METDENIQRLLCMSTYQGFLRPDGNVHIPWDIGIDHVSLDTFLKGALELKQRRGVYALLQVSLPEPLIFNELIREGVKSKLEKLEKKYPIHCYLTSRSVGDLQASHFFHNTCK